MAAAERAGGEISAKRRVFEHWLRTGLVPIEPTGDVETKFNPNHNPENGQFATSSTGSVLRTAAHASTNKRDLPLGPIRPVKLKPLSSADVTTIHRLAATQSVIDAMDTAWIKSQSGSEYGFFIYYDGNSYYPGRILKGERGTMTNELYYSLQRPDPLRGQFGHAVAVFHTHPDHYSNAALADNYDQNYGFVTNAITIIRTHKGIVVGR